VISLVPFGKTACEGLSSEIHVQCQETYEEQQKHTNASKEEDGAIILMEETSL
jgi:hypothetical protein